MDYFRLALPPLNLLADLFLASVPISLRTYALSYSAAYGTSCQLEKFSQMTELCLIEPRLSMELSQLSAQLELLCSSSSDDSKIMRLTIPGQTITSSSWMGSLEDSLATGVSTMISSREQPAKGYRQEFSVLGGKGRGESEEQKLLRDSVCLLTGVSRATECSFLQAWKSGTKDSPLLVASMMLDDFML